MVRLSRQYSFKFFKGCLPQILLYPLFNTLSQTILYNDLPVGISEAYSLTYNQVWIINPLIILLVGYLDNGFQRRKIGTSYV